MDLKHAIKVKEVLKPAWQQRSEKLQKGGVKEIKEIKATKQALESTINVLLMKLTVEQLLTK